MTDGPTDGLTDKWTERITMSYVGQKPANNKGGVN